MCVISQLADVIYSLFLTQPGGREVVYAPAGHNTTVTCAVSGIVLLWEFLMASDLES